MPSRSNTRVGENVEVLAQTPLEKKSLKVICGLMDDILLNNYKNIEAFAKNRFAENLLEETTDFRSLWYLINGMCHQSKVKPP